MATSKPNFLMWLKIFVISFSMSWTLTEAVPNRRADYSVTHLDIRDAILSLVSVLREQMDKLERHELRERQLGEQVSRSLAILVKQERGDAANIENIANYIARIEEKMKFLQATVEKQADERRIEGERVSQLLSLVHGELKEASNRSHLVQLSQEMDGLKEQLSSVAQQSSRHTEQFKVLIELWKKSNEDDQSDLEQRDTQLLTELADIKENIFHTQELISGSKENSEAEWQAEIMESLSSQRKQLAVLEEEFGKALSIMEDMTTSATSLRTVISTLGEDTKRGFELLDKQVDVLRYSTEDSPTSVMEKTVEVARVIESDALSKLRQALKEGQLSMEGRINDAGMMIDKVFSRMQDHYVNLSRELKGLSNIESVLLDTGDSVMEVRRRLEYGIQQITGDMKYQISSSMSNLNDSLQLRFDGLASSLLNNQSVALLNLTSRMDEDLGQVWRQIGILYQQVTQSASLLDDIHNQTSQYVNNSLDTMSSMDGKVGLITNRQEVLDENLNYMLGRLSLVVQEFNSIKSGLGNALSSINGSFAEAPLLERKPSQSEEEQPSSENEISVV